MFCSNEERLEKFPKKIGKNESLRIFQYIIDTLCGKNREGRLKRRAGRSLPTEETVPLPVDTKIRGTSFHRCGKKKQSNIAEPKR